jgi:hypothetical protein
MLLNTFSPPPNKVIFKLKGIVILDLIAAFNDHGFMKISRTLKSTGILCVFTLISVAPAHGMGYVAWTPSVANTVDFSQEISVNSASPNTAWKAQVRISSDMLFGIAVVQRSIGQFNAEFGTYFNQGVQNIAIPGQNCSTSPANGNQQNFINCSIPINFTVPSRFTLIIRRDTTDPTMRNWVGSIKNPSTGNENVIAKFDVGVANLSIQDILEYTYPFGDECQMVEQTQQAIYWKPISANGDYLSGSLTKSICGKVQFLAPANVNNVDGIGVTINPAKTDAETYSKSIYEILYPDAWNRGFNLGVSTTQVTDNKAYSELQSTNNSAIKTLQDQVTNLNSQMTVLGKQLKDTMQKISKICSVKRKPNGC